MTEAAMPKPFNVEIGEYRREWQRQLDGITTALYVYIGTSAEQARRKEFDRIAALVRTAEKAARNATAAERYGPSSSSFVSISQRDHEHLYPMRLLR